MDSGPGGQEKPDRSRDRHRSNPYAAGALAGMGVEIVASICGVGALGWLIDRWLGTGPWGLVVGLILGLVGGMYNSVKRALQITGTTFGDARDKHHDQR